MSNKWQGNTGNKNSGGTKVANNVVVSQEPEENNVMVSAKQFEQFLKLLPQKG